MRLACFWVASSAACAPAGDPLPSEIVPASGTAATATVSATFAAPTGSSAAASPAAAPSAAVPTASARTSWFGTLPPEPLPAFEKQHRYASLPHFDAVMGVPAGWHDHNIRNGMSGVTQGMYAIPLDRTAIVLVVDHGTVDESLVEYGAGAWLGLSGDGRVDQWGAVTPITVGSNTKAFTMRRAAGKLRGKPADFVMLRRRFPSIETGKRTLILAGGIERGATAGRRAEYETCLASFRDLVIEVQDSR